MSDEVVFQVRQLLISPCVVPGCQEWARWEISLVGEPDGWRVCSRHKRWAKTRLVTDRRPAAPAAGTEAAGQGAERGSEEG